MLVGLKCLLDISKVGGSFSRLKKKKNARQSLAGVFGPLLVKHGGGAGFGLFVALSHKNAKEEEEKQCFLSLWT